MSEPTERPVSPDLPPPDGTPDLDAGIAETVRRYAGDGAEPDEDVNPDAGSTEPPD